MRTTIALAKLELQSVTRDGTMLLLSLVPLLIFSITRFGLPQLLPILPESFQLSVHAPFIVSILLLFAPMLLSMVSGYVLLDDRDAGILLYLDATPVRRSGYLRYRLISPVVLSILYGFLMTYGTGIYSPSLPKALALQTLAGLEAPIGLLLMAGIAENKVEGLAVGKTLSLMNLAPFAVYLLPGAWRYVGLLLPQGWVSWTILAEGGATFFLRFIGGVIVHLLWITITYRWFLRRIG